VLPFLSARELNATCCDDFIPLFVLSFSIKCDGKDFILGMGCNDKC